MLKSISRNLAIRLENYDNKAIFFANQELLKNEIIQ
jgi:hypothetical protein